MHLKMSDRIGKSAKVIFIPKDIWNDQIFAIRVVEKKCQKINTKLQDQKSQCSSCDYKRVTKETLPTHIA